jgi:hypothetical protein
MCWRVPWRSGRGYPPLRRIRKAFFFEKKKQKTFIRLALASQERLGPDSQKFLVLFFKKELLPSFPPLLTL